MLENSTVNGIYTKSACDPNYNLQPSQYLILPHSQFEHVWQLTCLMLDQRITLAVFNIFLFINKTHEQLKTNKWIDPTRIACVAIFLHCGPKNY